LHIDFDDQKRRPCGPFIASFALSADDEDNEQLSLSDKQAVL
jgi:hypothetical protein